jgi:hypothetical protein
LESNASAHKELRAICEESRILFADGEDEVAELSEIEFAVLIAVIASEEEEDIVVGELAKT